LTDRSGDRSILDEIAKNAPGLVYQFRMDRDGTWSFPYVGAAVYERFGYSADAVQQDIAVFRTALHPDDREKVRRVITRSREDLSPAALRVRIRTADGSVRWIEAHATPVRTLDGATVWSGLALFRPEDAGPKESMRDRMRLGDTLRAMIDGISEVFAIVSPEGVIEFKSGNVAQVFGWSAEEMIGRPGLDLIHPDDRARVGENLREILLSPDRRIVTRARYRHRDGAYRSVELTAANRLADPVINGIVVKYRDITEQRRLEEENEERRLYLEGILESTPDAIITLDTNHRVVEWNPGAVELFGYTSGETVGRNLDDLVAGGDENARQQAAEYTSMVLERQTLEHTEAVRYRKDGTPVTVILAGAPIVMGDTLVGLVATYKDITRQKRAEARARELLQENTLMLREMRHRIRNDLGLVSSLLSLQAGQSSSRGASEALEEARSRIDTIARVYDRLDPDAGVGRVDIDTLLAGVVADLGDGSGRDGIAIVYRGVPQSSPAIHFDTRRAVALGIIVNELVTNANKYAFDRAATGDGGTITVTAETVGTRFEVTVRDNGTGVPESVISGGSRGFGFTVIEALLNQHGGSMEIVRDGGTVVVVVLPLE